MTASPESPTLDATGSPSPAADGAVREPREVSLRDPFVATVLAFLVPGLGHLYQGRRFKAAIYAVCVLGLFGWGMSLADAKPVSFRPPTGENAGNRKEFIYYLGQVGAGAVALPALVQYKRYFSPANQNGTGEPIDAAFLGQFEATRQPDVLVEGQVRLEVGRSASGGYAGSFEGQTIDGEPISLPIGDITRLGRQIENSEQRELVATVVDEDGRQLGLLIGGMPRPWVDRFEVPLSVEAERAVHAEYGTRFDLAAVITMIAGLLNFLAMYDAYDGPAYGYDARPDEAVAGESA